ncbi:MAG: nitrous oxide reductase accessory protein NosL [Bacteroidia bacterium]|nr:nitrous oxide reductase accessory protein NosL [Bacteroidia bacterium]
MNSDNKLKPSSRLLLVIAAAMLVTSMFVAIWRIELDAPQYPEGLALTIHANGLGGDVDIINGLNHYIGMQTLHSENFIEFSILRYLIAFFALFSLATALLNNKKILTFLLVSFILFGIISMIDFYRWNYNYGHNLDPNAAIIVPGMAYQPPLIGFKQLLNFGAYSIPAFGGWMFIGAGVVMLFCFAVEHNILGKFKKNKALTIVGLSIMFLTSCAEVGPAVIKINVDQCDFCKMTITDAKFASQLVTAKGRVYKFDDVKCMTNYKTAQPQAVTTNFYVADFLNPSSFLLINKATLINSENIKSPMGGGIAAFATIADAEPYLQQYEAKAITWQ